MCWGMNEHRMTAARARGIGAAGQAPTRGLATELIKVVHAPARPELFEHSVKHAHIVT
jgi:hypothetical protein